jgi:thiosulfate/3-mercaptopyruvate sulfurtransferase
MSELVISGAALTACLDSVRVVDVRDAWEFDGIGHVPGAVNIPFDTFRADEHGTEGGDGTGMLPGEEPFAALLGERGITRVDDIVAYDDHHGVFAARFLVTAMLYGHPVERLHLLDGDFSAWQREHDVSNEPPTVEPTTYETAPPAETPLVGIDAVESAVDDEETVIVDTREQWEYEEGHIPGAIRLDWRELVDDESRGLIARNQIEEILADRGISRDRRVLLYCNTARRISHTYWVLRWLGYEQLAFYEGSLTQWKSAGRPTEG